GCWRRRCSCSCWWRSRGSRRAEPGRLKRRIRKAFFRGDRNMVSGASSHAPYYFVPHPSKWPMVGSIALAFFGFGLASWVNGAPFGPYLFAIFIAILAYMMIGWFSTVARESESGLYGDRVDTSFRWSMSWFIFSEVMFFAAFFGALYYARSITTPWLGDLDHKSILWPDFQATWPNAGPAGV